MNTLKKPYKTIEETPIWNIAHKLTLEVYLASKNFPHEEQFGLTAQLRRSISSVPANITEGFYRSSNRELVQFLFIARGSLGESAYHLRLAKDLKYIDLPTFEVLKEQCNEVGKQLNNWIASIKRRNQT
jgi:four helix bundle protein